MYRVFLSFRFLRHHWLMTLIGSFFVGASLVILVVVMSVMDGFQLKLRETVAGSAADLTVTPRWSCNPAELEDALVEELGPLVVAAGPYYQTLTLIRKEGEVDKAREQEFHVAGIFGIDGRKEQRVNRFGEYIVDSHKEAPPEFLEHPFQVPDPLDRAMGEIGVIVGRPLLRSMRLQVGSRLRIMALVPRREAEDGGDDPQDRYDVKNKVFQIVGAYESGNHEIDSRSVFMAAHAFEQYFDAETAQTSVRLNLVDETPTGQRPATAARALLGGKLDEVAMRSVRPGVRLRAGEVAAKVETWEDLNVTLVQAIETEKRMILVIAFLIVVAGASSIFAAQWLLVSDKLREIGLLRALGARVPGVASLFVLNGFLMGLLGSAGGVVVGLAAVEYIDVVEQAMSLATGSEVFNREIYLFDSIPTHVDHAQVLRYAVAALVCTLIAAVIPALRAAFMDPAEALHRDG